jgi:ubiquitin-like-conjugating enzyme ATG3
MSSNTESKEDASAMTTIGYLRAAREWAYPTLKKSAFLEKGVLTPQEFVTAGDELVFRCPTWSWESGDAKKHKAYLPPDKQYLVTRHVPCQTRVASMEQQLDLQAGDDEESDWLVSRIISAAEQEQQGNVEDDFDILDETGEVVVEEQKTPAESVGTTSADDNDDEYADMADFEDDNVITDDAAALPATPAEDDDDDDDDNLVKVRTYDLSITYDKYYQVPRVWMVGKSAEGQPLSGQEMMEDVITDYANKTVTIEGHPHVAGPHASIHPCQHANVMKAIVRNLIKGSGSGDGNGEGGGGDGDEGPSVEVYIFIFLKFVSSMIPTINYDFTMDVTASTRK